MDPSDRTASVAVVEAVAEAEGTDPSELNPPLFDVVDVDSLDTVLQDGTGEVAFEWVGYRVVVDAEANVDLSPLP